MRKKDSIFTIKQHLPKECLFSIKSKFAIENNLSFQDESEPR